jgi:hypothetical protein
MKELLGLMHVGEEEVPNVKHMRIGEAEVSLSQPITVVVPPEEEEVPVPQGPAVMVPLGEEVPPEEEEVPAPCRGPTTGLCCHGPARGRSPTCPPIAVPLEEEEVPAPPVMVLPKGRGCHVLVPPLVSSSPFFFSQNHRRFFSPFFSHKRGRFVG